MYELSKFEFQKWVDGLDVEELTEYEITMLNIILDNFELVASGGTAGGVRARNIGKLIEAQKNVTQSALHRVVASNTDKKYVAKLRKMEVEYFRGFGVQQTFDFDKQYTFFHGPNGSGKTSFCEALEYCLLGNIEEATSRNIPVEKYIVHAGKKKAEKPKLQCIYNDKSEAICEADFEKYRFSFIEKNRIEKFSHIGAVTAKNQVERMAALFGLSEFQEFAKGFSAEIDKKYIKMESDNEEKYKKEQERLKDVKANLDKAIQLREEPQKELDTLVLSLNNPNILNVHQAIAHFDNPETGIITKLRNQMNEHRMTLVNKEVLVKVKQYCTEFTSSYQEVMTNNSSILSDLQSLNLKSFYDALINLEGDTQATICPACHTPMTEVVVNPFMHAKEEISKFAKIEHAKSVVKEKSRIIVDRYKYIKQIMDKCEVRQILPEIDYEIFEEGNLHQTDIELLNPEVVKLENSIQRIIDVLADESDIDNRLTQYNEKVRATNKKYEDDLKAEQDIYKRIIELNTKVEVAQNNEKRWKLDLEANLPKLEALEKSMNQEKIDIAYNNNMNMAYQTLIRKLNAYISTLPIKMAADLSEKAREYYNYINADDAEFELIETLHLPVAANEKIMISMKDGTKQDALQILSEGHVKILGLSILLAKAMEENVTFVIFDDIVNAVDDDHRERVAQLLITHPDFEKVQMILTCHGDLFVSNLEDFVKDKKTVVRYMFLPADTLDERGVFIKYQDASMPLKVAREKYNEGSLRDAAAKCRQAVECITGKLWKRISPKLDGISVKLRNLQGGPDLYNITGALKTATKEKNIEGIAEIHEDLERLMESRMWNVLNKGTHYDTSIPELNRGQIKELIGLLEKLAKEVDNLKVKPTVKP